MEKTKVIYASKHTGNCKKQPLPLSMEAPLLHSNVESQTVALR